MEGEGCVVLVRVAKDSYRRGILEDVGRESAKPIAARVGIHSSFNISALGKRVNREQATSSSSMNIRINAENAEKRTNDRDFVTMKHRVWRLKQAEAEERNESTRNDACRPIACSRKRIMGSCRCAWCA